MVRVGREDGERGEARDSVGRVSEDEEEVLVKQGVEGGERRTGKSKCWRRLRIGGEEKGSGGRVELEDVREDAGGKSVCADDESGGVNLRGVDCELVI